MANDWRACWLLPTMLLATLCMLAAVRSMPTVRTEAADSAKSDHTGMERHDGDGELNPGRPQFDRLDTDNSPRHQLTGSAVRLQCSAVGNPRPHIVWTHNGERLKLKSRSYAIALDDLQPEDSGNYTCTVCNVHGCIKHTQTLDVTGHAQPDVGELASEELTRVDPEILSQNGVEPSDGPEDDTEDDYEYDDVVEEDTDADPESAPTINETHPADRTDSPAEFRPYMPDDAPTLNVGVAGKMSRLKCPAIGRPEPNITWTRSVSDTVSAIPGGVQTVLKVRHLSAGDVGMYTCRACNAHGCAEHTVELRLLGGKGKMQADEARSNGDDADDVDYSDKESNGDGDGDGDADGDIGVTSDVHGDAELNPSAQIPTGVEPLAAGPPQFIKFSSFNRLLAKPSGNMVRMKCPATGNPMPTIDWTKDGGKPIVRTMGSVKRRQFSIVLEDLIPADSGNYTCAVCNSHGCINYTMKLEVNDRVNHKPIITSPPLNATVELGSTFTFPCTVLSDLHRNLQWFYSRTFTRLRNATKLKNIDNDNPEVFQLHNITFADEGWYTCVASNTLGNTVGTAYLRVVDKFPDEPVLAKMDADPLFRFVGVTAFASFLLIMAIIVVVQFRKIRHEKLMKHIAMETVHQWTKKIIIVKPSDVDGNGGGGGGGGSGGAGGDAEGGGGGNSDTAIMQIPIVKIEKQRTTLVQQSNSSEYNEYEFPLDSNWEWSRQQLTLGQTLGEGAFGRVVMAEAHGLEKGAGSVVVAVKMVKEGHTDTDMASLVREMEVMKMIGKHINIINLLGCCSQEGPLYVIVEYAPHGNLKDFLKKHQPLSEFEVGIHQHDAVPRKEVLQKDLISIAFQVARGMEYLASRRCIHRDLAARNVLVSDDYVVKIADFGLARDIQESEYYRKNTNGRLPIKWMAPESLRDKFYDSQSDVWSFGVLLWEIMTYGEQPYPQVFSSEHLYEFLREGNRMEKPSRCSLNIYMLMRQCWNWNSHERPTFTEIVENLDQILGANLNDEYLDVGVPRLQTPPSSDDDDDDHDDDEEIDSDAETLHEQSLLRYHHR